MQRIHVVVATAVLFIAGVAGLWLGAPSAEPLPVVVTDDGSDNGIEDVETSSITVHVAGAVRSPGLVTLESGDRVAHAVAGAGGALSVADLSTLNLAAAVDDGDQVTVPVKGRTDAAPANAAEGNDGLVNVNHGTIADLETLPGVGPVLAERIVEYRQQYGPFATAEDLLDVPGIGEGKLAALREALVLK